jgi:8-oxo-dGTP pyrophosphatase MutT (NUDIX family)
VQPGGKIDDDETPVTALCRELLEELGLNIQPDDADYLGRFSAPAANEPDCLVTAEMFFFRLQVDDDLTAQAEIEELCWVHPKMQDKLDLAPLTRDMVLPMIWDRRRFD